MKKHNVKLNVSGYRGIWGDTLTDKIIINYTHAFAKFIKENSENNNPSILIGRDGRENGIHIKNLIIDKLKKLKINAIDGDILPTPTILFAIRNHKYDGGIIITASHNPIEYNGFKFINKNALFLSKNEVKIIKKYYKKELLKNKKEIIIHNNIKNKKSIKQGKIFLKEHVNKIIKNVNVNLIRKKKWKIAVDMINASASVLNPYLFKKLGVELIPLNNIPNGKFDHKPEPIKENLIKIENLVKNSKANFGFAHDPDADRLIIINEKGEVISEEYSIAIAIENILSKNPNRNIVLNLSTSQMGSDIAKIHNSKCFRTKIGEGYVVDDIIKYNAVIGGEGNGGIIYPKINTVRDSFTGIALILELLSERNQTISECISTLPKYFMKKDKFSLKYDLNKIYSKLKSNFKYIKLDYQDGLRIDLIDKSWIHLRPSNTEPIIRLFGEAKTQKKIDKLFKEIKKIILK